MDYNKVLSTLNAVRKLCKTKATDIDYKRAYIPKGETVRPLGVPTLEWRIYLHMINNVLVT